MSQRSLNLTLYMTMAEYNQWINRKLYEIWAGIRCEAARIAQPE